MDADLTAPRQEIRPEVTKLPTQRQEIPDSVPESPTQRQEIGREKAKPATHRQEIPSRNPDDPSGPSPRTDLTLQPGPASPDPGSRHNFMGNVTRVGRTPPHPTRSQTSRTTEGLGTQEEGTQETIVAGLCEAGAIEPPMRR